MAIYHFSVQAISRKAGRSSTAAAAYRAAEKIVDARTGEIHDYSRKRGVIDAELFLPGEQTTGRGAFWSAVEQHHKRGDAVVAREFTIALPAELNANDRVELALEYGRQLAERYGVAVDVAVHRADRQGDKRNMHAHVLMSGCHVGRDGALGKKAVELDPIHCQRAKIENFAERERPRWAALVNQRLAARGVEARVDHRTLEAQGIERAPGEHHGPSVTAILRRGGSSAVARRMQAEAQRRIEAAAEQRVHVRAAALDVREAEQGLIDTQTTLRDALAAQAQARHASAALFAPAPAQPGLRQAAQQQAGVPDAGERLAAFRRAEDERAVRAELARQVGEGVKIFTGEPDRAYTGRVLVVTDYHVGQHLGRDWAAIHDRRKLQQVPEVGQSAKIVYGRDGQQIVQTASQSRSKGQGFGPR